MNRGSQLGRPREKTKTGSHSDYLGTYGEVEFQNATTAEN